MEYFKSFFPAYIQEKSVENYNFIIWCDTVDLFFWKKIYDQLFILPNFSYHFCLVSYLIRQRLVHFPNTEFQSRNKGKNL